MYQMYMPLAKLFYEHINDKIAKKQFNNSQNKFDFSVFENYVTDQLLQMTTDKTLGYEGEANVGYSVLKCLKDLKMPMTDVFKQKLDRQYSRYRITGKTEDFCQRFFGYGAMHVENLVQMAEAYQNSVQEQGQALIDEKTLNLLPIVKELTSQQQFSSEQIAEFEQKLQASGVDLSQMCDSMEKGLKESFTESLNGQVQATVDALQADSSKLKVLDGQDFNLVIHSSNTPEEFLENSGQDYHQMLSTSLIDNKNIRAYQSANVKFAFYEKINPENLLSAYSRDASTDFSDEGVISSFSNPDYLPLEEFKNKTRKGEGLSGYSEIMLTGQENIRPDAIVCYDKITEREQNLADQYNLDIILIETDRYKEMLKPDYLKEQTAEGNIE